MKITDITDFSYYENSVILNYDDLQKKIPLIERLFRNSREYKNYISYIRESNNIRGCAFFTDKDTDDVDIEIHHIINLYSICDIAGRKLLDTLDNDKFLFTYDILKEVIEIHMKDLIPVISLTRTIHQFYHSGQYELPKNSKELHLGNYRKFIQEYKNYLNKEEISKIYTYFNDINNSEFNEFLEMSFKEE